MLQFFILLELTLAKVLFYEAFTSSFFTSSDEWKLEGTDGIYSDCNGQRLLGGYSKFGIKSSIMKLIQLPPHHTIEIKFQFWKIDSWDNEKFYVFLDEETSYEESFTIAGDALCGNGWDDQIHQISLTKPHFLQSLLIYMTSTLNESKSNESWGIRDFKLYLHLCPLGCKTCQSTDAYQDCIPWTLFKSSFTSVIQNQESLEGWEVQGGLSKTLSFANSYILGGTGICGKNCQIQTVFNLPPHYLIKIKFRSGFIDSWDTETLQVKVNNVVVSSISFYYRFGGIRNYIGTSYDDYSLANEFDVIHSNLQIEIKLSNTLNEDSTNESMGLRDFEIFICKIFCYVDCKFGDSFNQACTQVCGNGEKEGSEICDDGNIYPFDGCFNCQYSCVEGCYECYKGICLSCQDEWDFIQENNVCVPKVDDNVITIKEECDDLVQFQRCFQGKFICPQNCLNCQFGKCLQCKLNFYLLDNRCQEICQNLQFINEKQCNDHNLEAFDSCHQCQIENSEGCLVTENDECIFCQVGWELDFQVGKCFPICGDSQIVGFEECDIDKFKLQKLSYGCTTCQFSCQDECIDCYYGKCFDCILGWQVEKYKCYPICGDENIFGLEECDDSNQIRLDGCSKCKNDCSTQCTYCVKGQCLDCLYGWKLNDDFQCEKECGDNQIALISDEECDGMDW